MAPGLRRLAVALTTAALLLTVAVSAVLVLQSSGQTSAVGSDTPRPRPVTATGPRRGARR